MVNFDELMGRLNKDSLEGLSIAEDLETRWLPTPSLTLNHHLNGGWVMGRQNLIWGNKSAGKSSFCMQQIAIAQKEGLSCAYFDVEGTYDKAWAKRLGVDNSEVVVADSKSMNKMVDKGVMLLEQGLDVMVIDSITALIPPAFETDGELKAFSGMGAMAGLARGLSDALKVLNSVMGKHTLLLLVSQSRSGPKGPMFWGSGTTGGQAPKFYSSVVLQLFGSEGKNAAIQGQVKNGDLIINKPIGREINYSIDYSKTCDPGTTGKYNFYFAGDHIGIDNIQELVALAVQYGIIKKGGSWYAYNGESIGQGLDKAADKLRNTPELFKEIEEKIGLLGQTTTDEATDEPDGD